MDLSFAEMVPNDIQSELKHLYVAVGELLRHFWSCFPVNTPFLEEKVRTSSKHSQLLTVVWLGGVLFQNWKSVLSVYHVLDCVITTLHTLFKTSQHPDEVGIDTNFKV